MGKPNPPTKQQQQPKQPKGGKDKSSKKKSTSQTEGAEEEEPLVAVVLADSFDKRFSPLTLHRPRCMLPFCGVPLINITLERLLQAQVAKVYILAKAHTDLLRRHIEALRNNGALGTMEITILALPEASSVGHAMQDLDRKEVIRGDFLLVQPDAIGNVDLREMVRIHTDRKKRDREAIMTIGMMQINPNAARSSPPGSHPIVAVRPKTHQLLHWHQPPVEPATQKTTLPFQDLFLAKALDSNEPYTTEVDLRADLRETGIDICGVEVPPLFSENFDYQKLRRDFVVGILTSDLLDSRLFLHIAPDAPHHISNSPQDHPSGSAWGYGARCDSTRAYDGIALDTLSGSTWPLTPGAPGWPGERLESRQACQYIGTQNVDYDRNTTHIGPSTLISSQCKVGSGSRIDTSTLCQGVRVDEQTAITGSHLFEEVTVGSNCVLTSCIVGKKATLLDNVKLEPGCIVGDYCVVGPNVVLSAGARVATRRVGDVHDDDDDDDSDSDEEQDHEAEVTLPAAGSDGRLGSESVGYLWPALGADEGKGSDSDSEDSEEEEEDDDAVETAANLRHLVIGSQSQSGVDVLGGEDGDSLSSIDGDSEFDSDSDSDDGHSIISSAPSQGVSSKLNNLTLEDDTHYETQAASKRLEEFRAEATASVVRAFEEGHTIENASIELKTLRMSTNVPLSEVRQIVIEQILSHTSTLSSAETEKWLTRWSPLITAISSSADVNEGVEILLFIQAYFTTHTDQGSLWIPILKKFYNDDIVSDEGFIAWWKNSKSREGEARQELRKKAEAVVRFIVESAQDSEEEESSEED
ncbi:unnamed protein product [Sympodiomycopsis kandeliae]